jgi:excisionase family DNA binding protein
MNKPITYKVAAKMLGISLITLRRWIGAGRIQVRRYSSNCVRIDEVEIKRFQDEALTFEPKVMTKARAAKLTKGKPVSTFHYEEVQP